jgi:hypothetical protein
MFEILCIFIFCRVEENIVQFDNGSLLSKHADDMCVLSYILIF